MTTSSLEALKLYSLGIDQNLRLDFEGARKYYEAALQIDTGFTSARASLGNINIEKFDPVKGRELLSQALKSVDNLTDRERLAILAFHAANVENNLPKAIEYNNTRIDLYPDDATARNNAGWYFQKAREINPDFIVNLYRLAHACRLQEQYDEAIPILKHIIETDKGETSAYYDLGVNFHTMGNLEEARKFYSTFKKIASEEWIKNYPDDAATYTSLAAVSARLGEMDSSKLMLQKAFGIDSTLHESFAEVLCLQGKANDALIQLQQALDKGYRNLFWLKLNPDLEILKYDIRFRDLLDKYFN